MYKRIIYKYYNNNMMYKRINDERIITCITIYNMIVLSAMYRPGCLLDLGDGLDVPSEGGDTYIYIYIYIRTCVSLSLYTYIYIYIYIYACVCVYVCVCVCVGVCVGVCVCT